MSHLPYIAAAYVIAVGLPLVLSVEALLRVRTARIRLAAIDRQRDRSGT